MKKYLFILMAVFVTVLLKSNNIYASQPNLKLHFNFTPDGPGNRVTDRSGSHNDGSLQGNPSLLSDNGINGEYVMLDGIDDYIRVSDNASLRPENSTASGFTWELWIKPAGFGANPPGVGYYVKLIEKAPHFLGIAVVPRVSQDYGRIAFRLFNTDGTTKTFFSSTKIFFNKWYHLVAKFTKATKAVELYINGIREEMTTSGSGITNLTSTSGRNLAVGYNHQGTGFTGIIDEVKIWNKPLSAAEISGQVGTGYTISPEYEQIINRIWLIEKDILRNNINNYLNLSFLSVEETCKKYNTVTALFNTAFYTRNLLKYAGYVKDYTIIDGLAGVYLAAFNHLVNYQAPSNNFRSYWVETQDGGYYMNINESNLTYHHYKYWKKNTWRYDKKAEKMVWDVTRKDQEYLHDSSEFLYVVASAINIITGIPSEYRTSNMTALVGKANIVIEHYDRWLVDGANDKTEWVEVPAHSYSYHPLMGDFIRLKNLGTSYIDAEKKGKNAIIDRRLWVLPGAVEILAANNKNATLIPLNQTIKTHFRNLVNIGSQLLPYRLTSSQLTDDQGNPVSGSNFDLGTRDNWGDYDFSGYTGADFPERNPQAADHAHNIGWDISHASRFVHVFETLYANRNVTGQAFPDWSVMQGLANQFAYGAFNKNLSSPMFSNYMDGITKGWYRVNYSPVTATSAHKGGYPSYSGVNAVPISGGYGFWAKYTPYIRQIMDTLWNLIKDYSTEDLSGKTNYGVVHGGVNWTTEGKINGAFEFDGKDGYVEIPGLEGDIQKSKNGTIEAWVKPKGSGQQTIFMHSDLAVANRYMFLSLTPEQNGHQHLELVYKNNATSFGGNFTSVTGNTTLNNDAWYHVAATSNSTTYKLYLNGAEEALTVNGTNSGKWFSDLEYNVTSAGLKKFDYSDFVGTCAKKEYSGRFFNGTMDEVRIYNRALPSNEIRNHYNGSFISNTTLVGYWNFDAGQGSQGREFVRDHYGLMVSYDANTSTYKKVNAKTFSKDDSLDLLMFLPTMIEEVVWDPSASE